MFPFKVCIGVVSPLIYVFAVLRCYSIKSLLQLALFVSEY